MEKYCFFIVVGEANEEKVAQNAINYINKIYEDARIVNVETKKCKIQVRNNVIKSKGKITFKHN
jgi:hypothetical protein